MLTNDHPQDSLPAFVLGTLDIDEVLLVNAHVMQCSACRAEVESFQHVLSVLPYVATPREPPAHIKKQLLARIAATAERAAPPVHRAAATTRWMQAVTGGALVLSLAFGVMLYDTNNRIAALGSAMTESQKSIVEMTARLTQNQQITMFIAAPQTVHRILSGADRRAHATMYMQPDNRQAVLVVEGLPRVEPGKTYQFWLAKPGVQVPCATFDVTDEGLAMVRIEAPAPVNQYDQVMVTIEQAQGATVPSGQIVLSGSLATALLYAPSRAD